MTEYGVILNNQLIIHTTQKDGDKPIVRTATPLLEYNESPYFWWEETEESIIQRWGINVIPDLDPPTDITNDEIVSILLGGETE